MKKENIEYAMKLNVIGDSIINISNLIELNNIESLKQSITKFEHTIDTLTNVKCPAKISDLHKQLYSNLIDWLNTVKRMMNDGLDSSNLKFAESNISATINKIAEKLESYYQKPFINLSGYLFCN